MKSLKELILNKFTYDDYLLIIKRFPSLIRPNDIHSLSMNELIFRRVIYCFYWDYCGRITTSYYVHKLLNLLFGSEALEQLKLLAGLEEVIFQGRVNLLSEKPLEKGEGPFSLWIRSQQKIYRINGSLRLNQEGRTVPIEIRGKWEDRWSGSEGQYYLEYDLEGKLIFIGQRSRQIPRISFLEIFLENDF